jgi:hypothetical protein
MRGMKTSDSIAEQDERTQARGDEDSLRENTEPVTQKRRRGDESYKARIAPWKWKPGVSANPGGRPKHDLASEIAKVVFENNAEALYKAFCKAAPKGNAYAFKELADRAYGKLRESRVIEHSPHKDVSDDDLQKHVEELEGKLIAHLVEQAYVIAKPPRLRPPGEDDSKVQ